MNKLTELVSSFQVELSTEQLEQFQLYYEMLVEKNKVMNLTAITEKDEVMLKHFADSLALAKVLHRLDKNTSIRLIDVGTGAGFPGIPLKIAFPELEVVLLDSLNKRVLFLQDVIKALQLKNITAVHFRAEDGARQKDLREGFDICVSRAVANLTTLSEYCVPFVKQGGYFVSYKSGNIDVELSDATKAIDILGGKVDFVDAFSLHSEEEIQRSLVCIKKVKTTPKTYPRKAGTASKTPLGVDK